MDLAQTTGSTLKGLAAGAGATIPMTAFMLAAQKVGAMGQLPPQKITDAAIATFAPSARDERRGWAALAHLAFGAGCGALYAALVRRPPRAIPEPILGALFGSLVWLGSYAGWVPALGIMPRPDRDRAGRPTSMVLAHWIFGASLVTILRRVR